MLLVMLQPLVERRTAAPMATPVTILRTNIIFSCRCKPCFILAQPTLSVSPLGIGQICGKLAVSEGN
jgi:hypothetical protein